MPRGRWAVGGLGGRVEVNGRSAGMRDGRRRRVGVEGGAALVKGAGKASEVAEDGGDSQGLVVVGARQIRGAAELALEKLDIATECVAVLFFECEKAGFLFSVRLRVAATTELELVALLARREELRLNQRDVALVLFKYGFALC